MALCPSRASGGRLVGPSGAHVIVPSASDHRSPRTNVLVPPNMRTRSWTGSQMAEWPCRPRYGETTGVRLLHAGVPASESAHTSLYSDPGEVPDSTTMRSRAASYVAA